MNSKLRHDLINEVERLKQIIILLSSEDEIPFTKEELTVDGKGSIEKLSNLWDDLN